MDIDSVIQPLQRFGVHLGLDRIDLRGSFERERAVQVLVGQRAVGRGPLRNGGRGFAADRSGKRPTYGLGRAALARLPAAGFGALGILLEKREDHLSTVPWERCCRAALRTFSVSTRRHFP